MFIQIIHPKKSMKNQQHCLASTMFSGLDGLVKRIHLRSALWNAGGIPLWLVTSPSILC